MISGWVPVATAWRVLHLRWNERSPIWSEALNILNKQSRTAEKEYSSSLWVGRLLTVKTYHIMNYSQRPRTLNDPLVRRKERKRDMSKRDL
jgi:hypothetical protein